MTAPSIALDQDYLDRSRRNRLIKRDGTPEDIAAMAAFLASDASGYVTGQVVNLAAREISRTTRCTPATWT